MKVLKKNVYTGAICVCTEFSTKTQGRWGEGMIAHREMKFDVLNNEEVFIKVGDNDFRQARDLYHAASKSKIPLPKIFIVNSPMQIFKKCPDNAGHLFINNPGLFYPLAKDDEKIELADVMIDFLNRQAQKREENSKNV